MAISDPSATVVRRSSWRQAMPALCGIASVVVGFLAWSAINFDSPRDVVSYLKGVRLVIEPEAAWVGEGRQGEVRHAAFEVRNLSNAPVTIIGVSSSCTCVSTDKLPIRLPAGGSRPLRVELRLDGKPSERVTQRLAYKTDHAPRPNLTVEVIGRVIE